MAVNESKKRDSRFWERWEKSGAVGFHPFPNELRKFSTHCTFTNVRGEMVQTGIGQVQNFKDHVEVEVLVGCSKTALLDVMHKVAAASGKPTLAKFNGKVLTV